VAETGDRSVSFDESWVIDVTQPLPDRYVLFDPTERSTVHEVGDLFHSNPGDQVAGLWTLDGCGDGEVDAVESGGCYEEQDPVAESDRLGGV